MSFSFFFVTRSTSGESSRIAVKGGRLAGGGGRPKGGGEEGDIAGENLRESRNILKRTTGKENTDSRRFSGTLKRIKRNGYIEMINHQFGIKPIRLWKDYGTAAEGTAKPTRLCRLSTVTNILSISTSRSISVWLNRSSRWIIGLESWRILRESLQEADRNVTGILAAKCQWISWTGGRNWGWRWWEEGSACPVDVVQVPGA